MHLSLHYPLRDFEKYPQQSDPEPDSGSSSVEEGI